MTEPALYFKEDEEYLMLQGRQVLRRWAQQASKRLAEMHQENAITGHCQHLLLDRAAVKALLLEAAQKQLEAGDE